MWQDLVFTVGGGLFFLALLPTLCGKHKPALSTSLLTGSILGVFAVTYLTMDMKLSFLATALTSMTWLMIAAQTWRIRWASGLTTGRDTQGDDLTSAGCVCGEADEV